MFNKILAAIASMALVASPVNARVDSGTTSLLKLIDQSGIPVTFNGDECTSGEYLGVYIHNGLRRRMELCPGDTIDALDHTVVRHEVWHAIQHCVNVARGTHVSTPVETNSAELMADVIDVLGHEYVASIKAMYPQEKWLLELEAFMIMEIFTAQELSDMFKQACTFQA